MTALHMLRSTISTVSAPANSSFRVSITHPTQPLCTLRVRRHRRLTQHSLPGGLLGLTWAGLAPANRASFAGAFTHSITPSARFCRSKGTSMPIAFAVFPVNRSLSQRNCSQCCPICATCCRYAQLCGGEISACVLSVSPVLVTVVPP
jgi:hypothetical protein